MAFDSILEKLNDLDYFAIVYKMLGGYVAVCAVYFVIASLIYNYRYRKAKQGLAEYNGTLKALIHADDAPPEKQMVGRETRTTDDVSAVRTGQPQTVRAHVNRTELVNRQLAAQQERKNQEIIDNVRKRNARIAAQQAAEAEKNQELEEERRRIRERRQQLEREQLQRLREEYQQEQQRVDHVYTTNKPNTTGRGE